MKNKNRILSGIISLVLFITLITTAITPLVVYAQGEVVYINSVEEFIEFAKSCSYDLYSKGKSFVLTKDISLKGKNFEPIPSFSGSFDGGGHSITDLVIDGAYSPCGLFGELCEGGTIKNLTVAAAISPLGEAVNVGGIVGINYGLIEDCSFIGSLIGSQNVGGIAGKNCITGSISGCTSNGNIIGESKSGGITGLNEGLVFSSTSGANVNNVSLDNGLSLEGLDISLTLDLAKLPSLSPSSVSDVGGITGYSTGMIIGCTSVGKVGYPHVGYNVGGIVGRSSGHLNGCINKGEVFGRKDVGGIVGHMEPYVKYELSEDLLASLKTELDRLSGLLAEATKGADCEITTVSDRLNSILANLDNATDQADRLIEGVTDYGDGMTDEVNRLGEILSHTLNQLTEITDLLPELTDILGEGLEDLEKALEELDDVAGLGANSIGDLILVARDFSNAFDSISLSVESLEKGAKLLENALTVKDKAAAEEAINVILDALTDGISSADGMTKGLSDLMDILTDVKWADDAIVQVGELALIFGDTTEAVSTIYNSLTEISDNIDIYWDKIVEAGDSLTEAVGCLATASSKLNDALDLMDSGLGNITDGLDGLLSAIEVNDSESVSAAGEQIVDGAGQLVNAVVKGSDALSELSTIFENLEDDPSLSDIIDSISGTSGDLSESGVDAALAISKLANGLKTVFENIKIDFDAISDSGSLIVGGVGDMTDALRSMRDATRLMSQGMLALDNAMSSLGEAVVIGDEEKLEIALGNISDAIGIIVSSMEKVSDILIAASETMEDAKAWGDEVMFAVSDLADSFSGITSAMLRVAEGVDLLRENLDFDSDGAKDGFDLILDGVGKLGVAAEYVGDALGHLANSFTDLEGAASLAAEAIVDLTMSINHFNDAIEIIADMTRKINSLLGYLSGVDPIIQLPKPGDSISDSANRLFVYISAIEKDLRYLNSDLTRLSKDLVERLAVINEIFDKMSDNIVEIIYGFGSGSIIDDEITVDEVDSVTYGKLFSCVNNGGVEGDLNVGGISGAMGLEYSLDPEDDLSPDLTVTQKQQYKLKAVIHNCINTGSIIAKYDAAGGTVGKMDLGLVLGTESYGSIESVSGNYVGGIAGISAGLISDSFAKCILSGGKYVGGILGSGVDEDYSGGSSLVRNCYSMVEINRFTQYAGAISGINVGNYKDNLFISKTLSGIDRVSYSGKAEPIAYEELIKQRTIPSRFLNFTLEFFADGYLLYSTEFTYGQSFDSSIFPKIPAKDGHYGRWDILELENLCFDTKVNVIYKPYTTSLGSDEKRDDGRDIFLAVGEFTDSDSISVTNGCDTSSLVLSEKLFSADALIESFIIDLPTEGAKIHFLPSTDNCLVFIKINGAWTEANASEFGSYLTFDITDNVAEIAVVKHSIRIISIVIIAVVIVIILIVAIVLTKKKRKTKEKENSSEENLAEEIRV